MQQLNPVLLLAALGAGAYFLLKDDSKNGDDEDGGEADAPQRSHRRPAPPTYAAEPPPMSYAPVPMPRMPSPRPAPAPVAPASASLTAAARALVAALQQRAPCDAVSRATSSFQQMALSEGRGLGPSGADGEYGPTTQRVLSAVLRQPAPPAVWGPGGRCHGAPAAPSGGGPSWDSSDSGPGSARPLLDTMNAMIADGDNASDADAAVLAYKKAGMFGVQQLGPAIDVQSKGRSKPLTQQAWVANGPLQSVPSASPSLLSTLTFGLGTAGRRATVADKMRAREIVTSHMRDTYRRALDQFTTSGFTTGIGTVIPSQYKRPSGCFDAAPNLQLCAVVAGALAGEQSPDALRGLAASIAASGFPKAANALLAKADSLG